MMDTIRPAVSPDLARLRRDTGPMPMTKQRGEQPKYGLLSMIIDEPTVMTMLGVASLTASAMFFTLHAFARHMAGVRTWSFGCLAVGFATLLDGPRLIQDWQLASLTFNIPFSAGQALFLIGTLEFLGRPYPKRLVQLVLLIPVVLTVTFTLLWPESVTRIFTLSVYQACVNGSTAWLLWRNADAVARRTYWIAALATAAQACAALAQAVLVATSPVAITYAAPELPFANIITWAGTTLNVLIGNWILFLLIMLRLVSDLNAVASVDSLTGLLNRRGLRVHIDKAIASSAPEESLSVLLMDIDHFKQINDRYGHEAGDKVLVIMGDVMRRFSSPEVVPCRWGGEEFCIVARIAGGEQIRELADQVRTSFHHASVAHPALADAATVSIGVATLPINEDFEFSRLVALADAQLYRAKQTGRDRVCVRPATGETESAMEFTI